MAAQILDVADGMVSAVLAAWQASENPPTVNDSVTREYVADVDLETMVGRRVYFFPVSYLNNPATRLDDEWSYSITGLVMERYTGPGSPPKDWIDERVLFVQNVVSGAVDFVHGDLLPLPGRGVSFTNLNNVAVFDADKLNTQKTFWSEITLELREHF
jgi:hypothetical protein